MQGKLLISDSGLFLKLIIGCVLVAFFAWDMVDVIQDGMEKRDMIMALFIYPALGYGVWYAFGAAHPVYFDNKFFYWTRFGREYSIACDNINEISVSIRRGSTYCKVKFYDANKKVKSIHFSLVDENSSLSYKTLLNELERIIRRTKPDFEVYGPY